MLSGKEDAKEIQLSAYLGDLVQAVFSLAKRYVQVKNTVGTIRLETQRAIPVGLIVNELATNALKHAFTDDGEARISLDLRHDDETDEFVLTFENTGNPFPEGIDLHNPTSTGLGLIAALVEQLNGSIEVRRAPITAFVLRFPHDPGRRFG
jgi:two-component sensor histidine kinase